MATVVQRVASFDDDAVFCDVVITTTSATAGNATGLRAVNTTDVQCYGELFLPDGTHKVGSTILPHSDTTIPIPTTQAARLPMTFNAQHNRWVGIRGNFFGPTNPLAAPRPQVRRRVVGDGMEIQHYPPDDE